MKDCVPVCLQLKLRFHSLDYFIDVRYILNFE